VTLPGRRDLAPSRGRRRRLTGPLVAVLAVVLLAAIAAGGYYLLSSSGRGDPAGASCPSGTPGSRAAGGPTPPAVHLRVLNGTGRNGLARSTGALLAKRGFVVDAVGNTAPATGPPVIRYGAGGKPGAELLALQLPQAALVADPRVRGRVDLVLAAAFSRLRTPAEVAAATSARRAQAAASPRPSPTCR